jgi:hypothetical protein
MKMSALPLIMCQMMGRNNPYLFEDQTCEFSLPEINDEDRIKISTPKPFKRKRRINKLHDKRKRKLK